MKRIFTSIPKWANLHVNRSYAVVYGAVFMTLSASITDAGISVTRTTTFPSSPELTVVQRPANNADGVNFSAGRKLTQTFQVTKGFTIDKFYIDTYKISAGQTFSLSIFAVADTNAGFPNDVPSGTNLLTTLAGAMPVSGGGNILEFDLSGADGIFLAANTGTAGYALQFETTDNNIPFNWKANAQGKAGNDQYPSGQAYATVLGADDKTHGNTDFTLVFAAASAPQQFSSWIADPSFGLPSESSDFTADPDADGLVNGLEAWFGTHPGEYNKGLERSTTDPNHTTFSHPQNANPPNDLSVHYQWSPNRSDWYAGDGKDGPADGPKVTLEANTNERITTVTISTSDALETIFLRMRVIQN